MKLFLKFQNDRNIAKNPHPQKENLAALPLWNCCNFGYKHSYYYLSSYPAFSPLIPITCTGTGIAYRAVNCTKGLTKIKTRISFGLGYFSSALVILHDLSTATSVFAPIESGDEKKQLWDGDWFWSAIALAFIFCWLMPLHEIL